MKIAKINSRNFNRFGWVIEYPQKQSKCRKVNLFRVILTESKPKGWRIALLVLRDRFLKKLEAHPTSFESFEPVRGKSLLFVTKKQSMAGIQCFQLNQPVILKKGIWHGVITLGKESEIKITEDAKVKCVYWRLGSILK